MSVKTYPSVYLIEDRNRRAFNAIAIAPLAIIIAVSILDLAGLTNNAFTPFGLFAAGFLSALYAIVISGIGHRQVILYEDSIEVRGWFSARKLKRDEILGRRMGGTDPRGVWGSHYILVPVDQNARVLHLPRVHVDKDFFSWMDKIPRLENKG
jgi:hypothetical protein